MAAEALGRRALLASAAALFAAVPARAQFMDNVRAMGGFSINGRQGPYIDRLAKRDLRPGGAKVEDAAGFNSGAFQSARMPMKETQARLEALLVLFQTRWPYAKPPPIKVHMIADGRYSPSALPDGSLAIPVGFLARVESDDELVYVLAHEYAHLALGHFSRSHRLRTQRRMITKVAQLYTASASVSQLRIQQSSQQINWTIADKRKVAEAAGKAQRAKERFDWVMDVMVEPAWSRRQEDESDAIGYDLTRKLDYAADEGGAAAFARLAADEAAKKKLINQLQKQLEESFAEANTVRNSNDLQRGDVTPFFDTFKSSVQSGLKDQALRAVENYMSPQHRPPQVRKKGIADYAAGAYPAAPLVELKTDRLQALRGTAEFKAALVAVNALQKAQIARFEGNFAAAEASILQAFGTPYGRLPVFQNEGARISRDQETFSRAEARFTQAHKHPEQTFDGFRDHVLMCISQRAYPRALAVIDIYRERTKTDEEFLPQLVRIKFKQRKNAEALAHLRRCLALEKPPLRDACAMNAFGPDDAEWETMPESTKLEIEAETRKAASKISVGGGFLELINELKGDVDN